MHQLWSGTVDANKGYRDEAKREWDVRLAKSGPYREYLRPTPTQIRAFTQLGHDAPNLSAATDYLISHVQLARRSRVGLRSGPRVLLIGPPAAGKTWWAEQVAVALGVACTTISLANVTASFEISGGSTQWMSAKPGRIVRAFLSSASASPVIVLDEVDKALTRNGYPTADALLDLVDRSSATRWHDEFYARDFNVATAIIIATANDPEKIEPPMRSRFQCFNVSAPRPDQMVAMVRSVWRHYRRMRHDLVLPSTLDDEVVEHIATHSEDARSVMREFDRAVANAAERGGRIRIGKADLRHPKPDSVYLPDPQDGALVH
jgi:ATP-dependent Lon protease